MTPWQKRHQFKVFETPDPRFSCTYIDCLATVARKRMYTRQRLTDELLENADNSQQVRETCRWVGENQLRMAANRLASFHPRRFRRMAGK